jgi:SAM-dependent methyltransferase
VDPAGNPLVRTFEKTAGLYERARPGWPAAAVDHTIRELGLSRSSTVLDVGAGTGKLTRMLVERIDRVIAVEPLAGMRAVLEALVPKARALAGSAEAISLGDDSVDAVFCAEAFHWAEGARAVAEIERVLRPRGGLALMWNAVAHPIEPSVADAADVLERRGHPDRQVRRYRTGEWREAFTGSGFEPLRQADFEHTQVVSRDGLVDYWASLSWIAGLPDPEREAVLAEVRSLLAAETYTRFLRAEVYCTQLVG